MKKAKKPVLPIYTVAIIWLIFSLFRPVYSIGRLIGVLVLSALGYSVARTRAGKKQAQEQETQPERQTAANPTGTATQTQQAAQTEKKETKAEKPKYSPEVQMVVDEGEKAQTELLRLYHSIPNLKVKRKIQEIMDVSQKIVDDAIADPTDVPQIKKFLDYYLPTTIKLLNAYDRMGAQGIEGENITKTMGNIEDMLDTSIQAYRKLLDGLFANQAMDIETDIQVMNTLLQREGLTGTSGFPK